jgi:hypothetical protein
MSVTPTTIDSLLKQAKFRDSFRVVPKGKTFSDLSTVVILPTRGVVEKKQNLICKKCKTKNEYKAITANGLSPIFVEAYKRLIKPMNVPIVENIVVGMEVGAAYTAAIEQILAHPSLTNFKYLLTIEDDNIIPFMPNTQGPLMMLYEDIEKYKLDVVGGLYWTKGNPSMPLIYGNPKEKRHNQAGMFKVRFPAKTQKRNRNGKLNSDGSDWTDGEIVLCNGSGMGFTLFKLDIFRDSRISKPWFETISDHGTTETPGIRQYTQDLRFAEKARELGYKWAIDTRIKVGHLDISSGMIF